MIKLILQANDNYSLQKAIKLLSEQIITRPVTITMQEATKKRSDGQNRLQWASMLGDFEKQARIANRSFSAIVWHEYLKEKFLPDIFVEAETLKGYKKYIELPDGKLKIVGSTTQLTTKGRSNYLESCYAYGSDLGIRFTCL